MVRVLLLTLLAFGSFVSAGCGCGDGKVTGGRDCATCEDAPSAVPGFHAAAGTVQSASFRLTGTLSHLDRGTKIASPSHSLEGRVRVGGGGR